MKRMRLPFLVVSTGLLLWSSCASTGTPGGGPKDTTSPRFLKSIPVQNQLNYNKDRVEIFFDELVSLEKPSEKILVSPPQKEAPNIRAVGNKVLVMLADSLRPSTTYSIDFTDAIVDSHEKNQFGDYAFSFSTGNQIDTLCISGVLLDASNLNPVPNVLIGVHSDLKDSSFRNQPFERISKTNLKGVFTVKGLAKKRYRLYALDDKNRDYRFDQPGEAVAFMDSVIIPWTEPCTKTDTVWKDSVTVDTVMVRSVTCFKPDDLMLRYFSEDFGRQYLSKRERPSREKILLGFGYKSETLPELTLLNANVSNWYLLEKNPTKDSLVYWITDTLVSSMDTLRLQVDYFKTDSLNKLSPATDTLLLVAKGIRSKTEVEKRKKKDREGMSAKPVSFLSLKTNIQNVMEIFSPLRLEWGTPVKEIRGQPWNLYQKKDTLWVKTSCMVVKDSLRFRGYVLQAKWGFGEEYRIDIDSGAIVGWYGNTNDRFSQTFKVRSEEEYSRLLVEVKGFVGNGFVEVLDKNDKVVRREKLIKNRADVKYLMPGSYYLRLVEDPNGNFCWDTGLFAQKRQPENVWYNPHLIDLRPNWDVEEKWNINDLPLVSQKPRELKPKASKR